MYTGEMVAVSEQQLIDCDHAKPFEDLGCEGGDFTGAFAVSSLSPMTIDQATDISGRCTRFPRSCGVWPLSASVSYRCAAANTKARAHLHVHRLTGGMQYIINNGGIDTEEDYPYMALDAKCAVKKEGRRVVTLDAWESVPPGNETALMQAVSQHPVAVGMCCGDYLDVRVPPALRIANARMCSYDGRLYPLCDAR